MENQVLFGKTHEKPYTSLSLYSIHPSCIFLDKYYCTQTCFWDSLGLFWGLSKVHSPKTCTGVTLCEFSHLLGQGHGTHKLPEPAGLMRWVVSFDQGKDVSTQKRRDCLNARGWLIWPIQKQQRSTEYVGKTWTSTYWTTKIHQKFSARGSHLMQLGGPRFLEVSFAKRFEFP